MKLAMALLFAFPAIAALAAPLPLPPGYPTLLGASCGGVHVSDWVTGFDANGDITGTTYAWTSCSTGGRGTRPRKIQAWHTIVWDLRGHYTVSAYNGTVPNCAIDVTDANGNRVYNDCSMALAAQANIVYIPQDTPTYTRIPATLWGKTEANARAIVEGAQLVFAPYYVHNEVLAVGVVCAVQTPAPGTSVLVGTRVSVCVNLGGD